MRTPLGRASSRRPDRSRPRPSPPPRRPRGPWKHGPVPVIGLVGAIGAGKSRVAALMAERGAQVLDADAIGHVLLDQPPARDEVLARFTDEVRDLASSPDDPKIDRKLLGAIVFREEPSRKALEAILHPRMRRTFEKAISRAARRRTAPAVVLDAAVLFEARWHDLCDAVVFVDAPDEVRKARVLAQRGWPPEVLAAREAAQMPADAKRSRCDFVIENPGDDPGALASALEPIWRKLTSRPRPEPSRPRRPPTANPDQS